MEEATVKSVKSSIKKQDKERQPREVQRKERMREKK